MLNRVGDKTTPCKHPDFIKISSGQMLGFDHFITCLLFLNVFDRMSKKSRSKCPKNHTLHTIRLRKSFFYDKHYRMHPINLKISNQLQDNHLD